MKLLLKVLRICLLLAIVFSGNLFAQTDTIYAIVEGDSVTIHHDQTHRNCASQFLFDVRQENFQLTVMESDTSKEWVYCLCYFDLSVGIGPLLSGEYSVEVYGTDIFTGDTLYLGSTNFMIESTNGTGHLAILSQSQSDCYTIIDVDQTVETIPGKFKVSELYPNPFNPVTNISLSLPASGKVEIEIYNLLGQKVAEPLNKYLTAGEHSILWDASEQPSGIYLVRLKYGNVAKTQKAVLLK